MVKNKEDKMKVGIDFLMDEQFKKEKKEMELKESQKKILESYNMIVKKLCLEEWDDLKKIVDGAFEKEKIAKGKKLTITSADLTDFIDYEELNSRI